MNKTKVESILLPLRFAIYALTLPLMIVLSINPEEPTPVFLVLLAISAGVYAYGFFKEKPRTYLKQWYQKKLIRMADLILWNILLFLYLGEIMLSIFALFINSPILIRPDAKAEQRIEAHRPIPHFWINGSQVNSRGYNDSEWQIKKPKDITRIVALGDSFCFGIVGYQDNFLTLLEQNLGKKLKRKIEVINLGITATQPADYLQILTEEGRLFEPDIILVCFYSGNDYQVERYGSFLRLGNWRIYSVTRRILCLLGEKQLLAKRHTNLHGKEHVKVLDKEATYSEEAYDKINQGYLTMLKRKESRKAKKAYPSTLKRMDEIAKLAAPVPVVVAVIPSELQIRPQLRKRILKQNNLKETDLDLEKPARALREYLEPKGVKVIDLLQTIREADKSKRCYHPRDTHWNIRGNKVAGEKLTEEFLKIMK